MKLTDVQPQKKNANRHTPRGIGALERSIQQDGWIGAITVAADGETFDGSARVEVGAGAGFEDAIVVDSDGTKPVIVRRKDIPTADDPRAVRLGVAANRVAQLDLDWNTDVLADLQGQGDVLEGLFTTDELDDLLANLDAQEDEQYSRKITSPVYEPSNAKPPVSALYDDAKTKTLISAIVDVEGLTDEERTFLIIAARRHTVLHYNKIADYYAHASAHLQRLMEDSALVIIDFNRAIELGFVKLAEGIAEQYGVDYGDD